MARTQQTRRKSANPKKLPPQRVSQPAQRASSSRAAAQINDPSYEDVPAPPPRRQRNTAAFAQVVPDEDIGEEYALDEPPDPPDRSTSRHRQQQAVEDDAEPPEDDEFDDPEDEGAYDSDEAEETDTLLLASMYQDSTRYSDDQYAYDDNYLSADDGGDNDTPVQPTRNKGKQRAVEVDEDLEEGDESPRRHSGKPKKQLAPDDAMDVDPEDEGMDEPQGPYLPPSFTNAMADVFKYNIADEGRLLPDADKPMARSVRMLYDAIGDGPDQFGEDAQALADKLLLRAPRRRGGNPDDDQDEQPLL